MSIKKFSLFFTSIVLLSMTSCFATEQPLSLYGFWGGLWHGIIILVSLVLKLVSVVVQYINPEYGNWNINVFSFQNEGLTYWVGFVLGIFLNLGVFSKLRQVRRNQ